LDSFVMTSSQRYLSRSDLSQSVSILTAWYPGVSPWLGRGTHRVVGLLCSENSTYILLPNHQAPLSAQIQIEDAMEGAELLMCKAQDGLCWTGLR